MSDPTSTTRSVNGRLLFGFLAMLLIFGLLAWRSQNNETAIKATAHAQQVNVWNQCEKSITNTTKLNNTNAAFAALVQTSINLSPAGPSRDYLAGLLKTYQDNVLAIPECGPKP